VSKIDLRTLRPRLSVGQGAADEDVEATPPAPVPRPTAVDVAVLVGLTLLLAFLWGRGRHVWFWLDEGISVGISSHPLSAIPELLRQDGSPPLYYGLLHVWMSVFGTSDEATHLLSLLFALATVPAALWAGWSLFGRRAGWMAVALVAVNPFLAAYANETRMYTLVALLGLMATATFLHAFVFGRRRYLPLFGVSLALLLYSHNWALFFAVGAGVALLGCIALAPPAERRRLFLDGVLAFGGAGLLYVPWLPSLAYQVAHTGAPFTLRPTLLIVRRDLETLLGGPEAVVALGLGSGVAFMTLLRRPWTRPAVAVLAAVAIALVTVGGGWAVSRHNSVWVYRYLAVMVGPMLLALAAGLAEGGRGAVAAVGVTALLFAPIDVKGQAFEKSNVKEVATELGATLKPGDLVVADFGRIPVLVHYLPPGLRYAETTGPVADPRASDQRDSTKRLDESHPSQTVLPSLDALVPGAHVLFVCSAGELARDATPFLRLIAERCTDALSLPEQDPSFRLDGTVAGTLELSNSPVNGFLFTKL
jgi:mannosyltransferase